MKRHASNPACSAVLRSRPSRRLRSAGDTVELAETFEAQGKTRIGMVLGNRILDLSAANAYIQAVGFRGGKERGARITAIEGQNPRLRIPAARGDERQGFAVGGPARPRV